MLTNLPAILLVTRFWCLKIRFIDSVVIFLVVGDNIDFRSEQWDQPLEHARPLVQERELDARV
jgi:hypothetical protein